jgi:hypothetical protein
MSFQRCGDYFITLELLQDLDDLVPIQLWPYLLAYSLHQELDAVRRDLEKEYRRTVLKNPSHSTDSDLDYKFLIAIWTTGKKTRMLSPGGKFRRRWRQ